MNRKSNTLKSFSTESNQVSVKRITMVIYLKLGTSMVSPARSFQTQRENCEPVKQHQLNWTHCKHTKHGVRSLRMIIDSNWLLGKATQASTGTLLTNLFSTDPILFSLVNLYFLIINHIVCISENLFILNLYFPVPLWSKGSVRPWAAALCTALLKAQQEKCLGKQIHTRVLSLPLKATTFLILI